MYKYSNLQDIFFDCAVTYRFFNNDCPIGDLLGISVGIKNNGSSFNLASKDIFNYNYYAAYCCLDATLLKITSGYVFSGKENVCNIQVENLDGGFFFTISGLYRF